MKLSEFASQMQTFFHNLLELQKSLIDLKEHYKYLENVLVYLSLFQQ